MPVSVAADPGRDGSAVPNPHASLRTPRLNVSLLSVETAGFVGATAMFFTFAATDDGGWLDMTDVYLVAGVATWLMSAWSTGMLVRSSRELRWRRSGTADATRSARFNRAMMPYDAVMALSYVSLSSLFAVAGAQDGAPAIVATAIIGGALGAGLHLWSLAANARERKRYKTRRIALSGTGFRW
jgi:hypothetical protein